MESIEVRIKKNKVTSKILSDPNEILNHLHKGISIPILPEFHKYILRDLTYYKAQAIVLEEEFDDEYFGKKTDTITGMILVYDDGSDILFFGFCGVYDHDPKKIKALVDKLIIHGKENGYRAIRGPINIPTVIFGWGFMIEGSKKDLFIGSPINPPIYQETFFKRGFEVLFQEDRYEMPALRMNPHKDNKLISMGINDGNYKENVMDTGNYPYEFLNPGKEDMPKYKEEFVSMYQRYMPPSAQITPKTSHNVGNLIDFIFEFGAEWMMWVVRHKETGQMVSNGYVIPDVFSQDKKGEINSISFHSWVVHPEHRRKYLAMFMYGFTSLLGKDRKTPHFITKGSWPVGAENTANGNAAKKMGGKKDRSHLILSYII